MPVIARDAVASDHLVYAWPFPIGADEYVIACADDEQVVMCPAWLVGDRLGPGRHRWRTPDPTRPASAFFVLTAPVEVPFDMTTSFMIPNTGQPVRLRCQGSMHVRCGDPALLIAQFVGLPFDQVNEGVLRSVSRSIERMLGRLLARRVVMAGTPVAVTEPAMLPSILEELIAYNPAAGAVFGIELMRMGHVEMYADDGSRPRPWDDAPVAATNGESDRRSPSSDYSRPAISVAETVRAPVPNLAETIRAPASNLAETIRSPRGVPTTLPPLERAPAPSVPARSRAASPPLEVSGEINVPPLPPPPRVIPTTPPQQRKALESEASPARVIPTPPPGSVRTTSPGVGIGMGGAIGVGESDDDPRGAIMGIGMSHIGSTVSGEIPIKIAPGGRVLVPGPNGLMQSATVRQLVQGYYELEVGGSGETIWVPLNGVVPE